MGLLYKAFRLGAREGVLGVAQTLTAVTPEQREAKITPVPLTADDLDEDVRATAEGFLEAKMAEDFGANEKKYGINEHAPTLKQWQEALKKAGFTFSDEIAKLSFLTGKLKADKALRSAKRTFLALPLMGRHLAKYTITDYNFYATKK